MVGDAKLHVSTTATRIPTNSQTLVKSVNQSSNQSINQSINKLINQSQQEFIYDVVDVVCHLIKISTITCLKSIRKNKRDV